MKNCFMVASTLYTNVVDIKSLYIRKSRVGTLIYLCTGHVNCLPLPNHFEQKLNILHIFWLT